MRKICNFQNLQSDKSAIFCKFSRAGAALCARALGSRVAKV